MVRGWANNVVAKLNRHKNEVAIEYNWLDVESKHRQLHDQEKEKMRNLSRELEQIWNLEEIRLDKGQGVGRSLKVIETLLISMQWQIREIGKR
jgi:hypothetical protein